jgi:GDPmannose 4,6-dehydratase
MLQQKKPEDFVIATGQQYSVRDFINEATKNLNMQLEWNGKGTEEIGSFKGQPIVIVDQKYFRPTEVESLLGDARKAKQKLNWVPKTSFQQLVKEMINEDLKLVKGY